MVKLYNTKFEDIIDEIRDEFRGKQLVVVAYPPYRDVSFDDAYYNCIATLIDLFPSVIIHYPEQLYTAALLADKVPTKVLAWIYNSNVPRQHKDIAFFNIKPNLSQVKQEYKNLNDKRVQERLREGSEGAPLYDWFEINQINNVSDEKTECPSQIPIDVVKNVVGVLPLDCVVVDPFMGSGTVGVAVNLMNVEQHANRGYVGTEEVKQYFDIAEKRINNSGISKKHLWR